jgi:chromosomal replication initiation ATPase DnaA
MAGVMTLLELEAAEPFEPLESDERFERAMKMGSLSLLRAVERAQGRYDPPAPTIERRRREVKRPTLYEAALGKGVVLATAAAFDQTYKALIGKERSTQLVLARSVAARLLRDQVWSNGTPRFSYPQIGRLLGSRDHSTICHAISRFDYYCEHYPRIVPIYEALRG